MTLKSIREGLAYVSVAGLSAASDWLVFTALSWVFPAQDVVFAQAPARLTGGLVAFLMHRSWSFGGQQGHGLDVEARRFMTLYVFSFVLSIATVHLLADLAGVNRYWSKAFADTLCFVVNFIVMKHYVFAGGEAPRSADNLLEAKKGRLRDEPSTLSLSIADPTSR